MARFARSERLALADLLLRLGPEAPTLCEGWKTRDLAAHLVVRERRPDAAAGLVLPPLRGRGERVRAETALSPYADLVDRLRRPPWWSPVSNPLADRVFNPMELFIHHEDVRRAQSGWQPRELPPAAGRELWRRVPALARFALRRLPAEVTVQAPGYGQGRAGAGGPRVRLIGAPGELLMFMSGRQRAARVQVDGPAALAERVRGAALAL
ncbi:MAG TPA: TIGR03085 family metal-binding protein [Pilimelia sp.]|nr:TIGR03085 family metal-binding protein [Pilimelia sp.]